MILFYVISALECKLTHNTNGSDSIDDDASL